MRIRSFLAELRWTPKRVVRLERELKLQRKELRRLTSTLAAVRADLGTHGTLYPMISRAHADVEALLRYVAIDGATLSPTQELVARRFGLLSQNAEDGITLAIVKELGIVEGCFVDIGCGWNGGNCGILASELGWSGTMIDADPAAVLQARLRFAGTKTTVIESRVTRENVEELVAGSVDGREIDVLSIDIDGMDYWVLEALLPQRPRVLIVEYNAALGPDRAVTIPYDPAFQMERGSHYFGASLAAFDTLGRRNGYRLVAVEPRGINAFFVRDDVAGRLPALSPAEAYKPLVPAKLAQGQELRENVAQRTLEANNADEVLASADGRLIDVGGV
jgi:hypothetical protein